MKSIENCIGYSILCIFSTSLMISGYESGETSQSINQIDQYCRYQCNDSGQTNGAGRPGKTGPIGPPGNTGPPGQVDYTVVKELISSNINVEYRKTSPEDCVQVAKGDAKIWNGTGGVFDIYPGSSGRKIEVYCDMETDGGGWTVFQRRMDGLEDFYRTWADYVNGFGETDKEFWMGLEKLHRLTLNGEYELRIDLGDWNSQTAFAQYTTFRVGHASTKYRLEIAGYSGTAGDSLSSIHDGQRFSTYDQDSDASSSENCAANHKGGWWFKACDDSNLNGLYHVGGVYSASPDTGVEWTKWKGTGLYSMKFTEMKFRPKL